MVRTLPLLILGSFLVLTNDPVSAQNGRVEKKVVKIDRKLLHADKYRKAIKKGKAIDRKISKAGETPEESYAVNVLLNKAYLLNGNPVKAAEYLDKATLDLGSITVDSMNSSVLFNPGALYIANGRYSLASEYLTGKTSFGDKVRLHHSLVKQGELLKAQELEIAIQNSIAEENAAADKLRKKQKMLFYADLYQYYIQIGERMQMRGQYDSALAFLQTNRREMSKLDLKRKDTKAEYNFALGRIYLDNGEYEQAEKYLDIALEKQLKEHKTHNPRTIEILAACLESYYLLDKDRKLLIETRRNYSDLDYYRRQRNSLNTVPLLLAEMERKVTEGNFREADRTADALLKLGKNYEAYPCPATFNMYSKLYSYYITRDNYDNAQQCLAVLDHAGTVMYGSESPMYALLELQLDQFRINYEFDRSVLPNMVGPKYWGKYADNFGPRHYKYLSFLNSKASAYALGDQLSEQTATLEDAVRTAEDNYGQNASWARQLVVLAEAELNKGNFAVVPGYLNRAMPILEQKEGKNSLSYLTASRVMAEYYENTGKLDEARDIYRKTFKRLDRLSRRAGVNSFSQPEKMAQVFLLTGDYNTAEKQLDQAIEQKTKTYGAKTKIVLIEPYVLSAKLNYFKGNYIAAQENAQKAIDIGKELNMENSLKIQQAFKILADVDYAIGDYRAAERRLEKIVATQEKSLGHDNPLVAASLLKLSLASYYSHGNAQLNKARVDDAAGILYNSLGSSSLQLADAQVYQGMFCMELQQYDSALNALQQAQQIYNSQLKPGSRESARVICLTGDVYKRQGKFQEAETNYKQAAESYKKLLGKGHPDYLKTQSKLARVKCDQGQYTQAFVISQTLTDNYQKFVDQVFPYLSEREKTKYWQQLKEDFDLYYALAFEIAPGDQKVLKKVMNSRINTKALLLRSSVKFQKDVRTANVESVSALFDKWLSERRQLAASFGMSPEELAEAGVDPIELEAAVNYDEKQLRRKLYGKNDISGVDKASAIFSRLGKDKVLVETVRYNSLRDPNKAEYAFIVADPATKKFGLTVIKNGDEIESGYYKYYKNAIRLSAMDKYSYQNYWMAVDSKITDGKQIYFSPDGVFGLMNPETFVDETGKYVLEKNPVVVLNNPGDLFTISTGGFPSTIQAELVGDPTFYPTTPSRKRAVKDLPATGEEIGSINSILQSKGATTEVMTRELASEDSVKHIVRPGVLHFATHGYFEDPGASAVTTGGLSEEETGKHPLLQSGLLLANSGPLLEKETDNIYAKDGILTAFEAKDLDLSNTELVVLSACETGVGRVSVGEGVIGLQRAFLDAGSNSVMMSLFKVNDQATKELMECFYRNWIESGNKQAALVKAKMEIKEKYHDPILWGSFILIGN